MRQTSRWRGMLVALAAIVPAVLLHSQHAALAQTLSVSSSSDLPAVADVTVAGTGFAANQSGTLMQCKLDPVLMVDRCDDIGTFTTDEHGDFSALVTVMRIYVSSDNTEVNCIVDPQDPCRIVAVAADESVAEAPITFGSYLLAVPEVRPAAPRLVVDPPSAAANGRSGVPVVGIALLAAVSLQAGLWMRTTRRRGEALYGVSSPRPRA